MGNSIRIIRPQICQDCGEAIQSSSNRFMRCIPCGRRHNYQKNMLTPVWRISKLMSMAKNRAKDKNLPFNLDIDYLMGLWDGCQGICEISGRKLDLESSGKFAQVNSNAPSIDRKIPEKGYIKGNVRFVTYHVNISLSEFGDEKLLSLCADILNNMNKQ